LKRELLLRRALEEVDFDPAVVIRQAREIFDRAYPEVEIIAGSMRSVADVKNAALAGAHIVTVPPKFFPDMISHFKTDEVVQQFLTDFAKWLT
jgi:transaldolase